MIIDSIEYKIKPTFKPKVTLAREYYKLDSGNWRALDYGVDYDIYESQVTFIGTTAEMTTLYLYFQNVPGRTEFSLVCHEGEEIFGCGIDYGLSITVAAFNIGQLTRTNLVTWELSVLFKALPTSITPIPGVGSLDALRFKSHNYIAHTEFIKNFSVTGDGLVTYTDHQDKDIGIFKATFLQTRTEMIAIRQFLIAGAGRSSEFSWTLPDGIYEPFGLLGYLLGYQVRIIDWVDNGKLHPGWWTITITFAQEK